MASVPSATYDVVAIGNAIVDVLAHSDDAFLEAHGMTKGTMALIDAQQADDLYQAMGTSVECSGGAAANTAAVIASLGGKPAFIGKIRDDILGTVFSHDIKASGVAFASKPADNGTSTARCLVLVTEDAQRTMNTYLGACRELTEADVDPALVADCQVVYLEGYLWDAPEAKKAMIKACEAAKAAGRKVAMSLSDPFCVHRHREEFQDLVKNQIDILFANEEEAIALFESETLDQALAEIHKHVHLAAVTRGKDGCVVISETETFRVAVQDVARVVDTTGAGDAFAAGFLRGYTQDLPLQSCGVLGNAAAGRIISHFGARPERPLTDLYMQVAAE